jgi:hypothetical protein
VFSSAGVTYGKVCQAWGVDPAAPFRDDVIAHNVRVGLLVAMAEALPEPEPEAEPETLPDIGPTQGKIVTDLEERMRAYGQ